ncbi:MAG: hypothetical protein Q9174_007406, partial [Haloplaca sp. 1 TL-2023]
MAPTDYLNILVITFNCGRELIKPNIFAQHLSDTLSSSPQPDILVFSLQEIAPVAHSFLGGSYLASYFQPFRHAVEVAAKAIGEAEYVNIITRNVGMTACLVFILQELQEQVQWIEAGGVGVGMYEMGNKGAVGIRLGYAIPNSEVMDLTFVAAHLAPMEEGLERRNEDWKNIVRSLVFCSVDGTSKQISPITSAAETNEEEESEALLQNRRPQGIYTPTSHFILAGDLNYRTSHTKPLPQDHKAFPQPTRKISDPPHFSHLLQHDQLTPERKADRTCHGFSEAPIHFPPTYKYSSKAQKRAETDSSTETWDWAKHRWPSWCDRILYLNLPPWSPSKAAIEVIKYDALPLMPTSDHRPVFLTLKVPLKSIPPPQEDIKNDNDDVRLNPPFDIDPQWRQKRHVARRKEVL